MPKSLPQAVVVKRDYRGSLAVGLPVVITEANVYQWLLTLRRSLRSVLICIQFTVTKTSVSFGAP